MEKKTIKADFFYQILVVLQHVDETTAHFGFRNQPSSPCKYAAGTSALERASGRCRFLFVAADDAHRHALG